MIDLVQTVLLALVVVYCGLEQLGARRWRRTALQVQEKQFKAALATWARVQGKQRLDARDGRQAVLASREAQNADAETDFREAIEEFTHPHILVSRSDSA